MAETRPSFEPLSFYESVEAGTFCLTLSDDKMCEVTEVFESNGRDGHGYDWTDVALGVIRAHFPELESEIELDPEAGTFAAYSENREALGRLGKMLSEAFADQFKLASLVAGAPSEHG